MYDLLYRKKLRERERERKRTPLMLDLTLLSTREWTISTIATLAAMEIWSHLIAWWTVDLFWKSRIMAWPASARLVKTMTRTHSMQVSRVHLLCHWIVHSQKQQLLLYFRHFPSVSDCAWFPREALDGSWAAHIRPPSSSRDTEGWCVQFWHHTAGNSPEEWPFLCGRHGPQPQR